MANLEGAHSGQLAASPVGRRPGPHTRRRRRRRRSRRWRAYSPARSPSSRTSPAPKPASQRTSTHHTGLEARGERVARGSEFSASEEARRARMERHEQFGVGQFPARHSSASCAGSLVHELQASSAPTNSNQNPASNQNPNSNSNSNSNAHNANPCDQNGSSQVRTLFVSGLPMDAKPRELYLLFRAYKVSRPPAN